MIRTGWSLRPDCGSLDLQAGLPVAVVDHDAVRGDLLQKGAVFTDSIPCAITALVDKYEASGRVLIEHMGADLKLS